MQAYIDIAAGCVGVRADLVRGIHQRLGVGLLQTWQADAQVDIEAEAAFDLADADIGGNRGFPWQLAFALGGDELQCTDEAGCVAGREQLFGIK